MTTETLTDEQVIADYDRREMLASLRQLRRVADLMQKQDKKYWSGRCGYDTNEDDMAILRAARRELENRAQLYLKGLGGLDAAW